MGLLLRYTRLSLNWATLIFVPLVGVAIWIGQFIPLDVGLMVQHFRPGLSLAEADLIAQKIWDVLLLGYCLVAGVVPVWLLLQPRGHLGGVLPVRRAGRRRDRRAVRQLRHPVRRVQRLGRRRHRTAKRFSHSCSSRSPAAPAPAFIR